jgi:hypothetical protein
VRGYWTRQWRSVDPQVEPQGFRDAGDGRIIVEVRQRVRDRAGALLRDQMVQHVYNICDGLGMAARTFSDRDIRSWVQPRASVAMPDLLTLRGRGRLPPPETVHPKAGQDRRPETDKSRLRCDKMWHATR